MTQTSTTVPTHDDSIDISRKPKKNKRSKMATSMLQPGIFNTPRPKRSLLPNPNKKRKMEHKVEEISFDDNARADYLTGFHKRKVERAKRAKAEAEKKMREERVGMRKQVCSTLPYYQYLIVFVMLFGLGRC
jgi:Nucleolar protein 12 (25kDa)